MLSGGGCGRTVSPCQRAHSTSGFFLFTSLGLRSDLPFPSTLSTTRYLHCWFVPRDYLFSLTHSPLRRISVVCSSLMFCCSSVCIAELFTLTQERKSCASSRTGSCPAGSHAARRGAAYRWSFTFFHRVESGMSFLCILGI